MERINNLDEALKVIEDLKQSVCDKQNEILFLYNIIKIKNDEIVSLKCLYMDNDKQSLASLYGDMKGNKVMAFKTLESAIEYIDKLERKLEIYENVFDEQNDLIDELMKGDGDKCQEKKASIDLYIVIV